MQVFFALKVKYHHLFAQLFQQQSVLMKIEYFKSAIIKFKCEVECRQCMSKNIKLRVRHKKCPNDQSEVLFAPDIANEMQGQWPGLNWQGSLFVLKWVQFVVHNWSCCSQKLIEIIETLS